MDGRMAKWMCGWMRELLVFCWLFLIWRLLSDRQLLFMCNTAANLFCTVVYEMINIYLVTPKCILVKSWNLVVILITLHRRMILCKIVYIPPLWHLSSSSYAGGMTETHWATWMMSFQKRVNEKSLITLHDLHDYTKSKSQNNSHFLMKCRRNLTWWINSIQ